MGTNAKPQDFSRGFTGVYAIPCLASQRRSQSRLTGWGAGRFSVLLVSELITHYLALRTADWAYDL